MNKKYSDTIERSLIKDEILDKPLSFNQMRHMIDFILQRMKTLESIIEHYYSRGEDVSHFEYELNCAEYALGLRGKPDIRDYDFYNNYNERKVV